MTTLYFYKHPEHALYLTYGLQKHELELYGLLESDRYDNLVKGNSEEGTQEWLEWVNENDSAWDYLDADIIPITELIVVAVEFPD
jgi:hypothetical protein